MLLKLASNFGNSAKHSLTCWISPRANTTKGRKPPSSRRYVQEALSDSGSDLDPRDVKSSKPTSAKKASKGKPDFRDDDSAIHDIEKKNTEANKKFRHKRDGYLSDEGAMLKGSKKGKAPRDYSDDEDIRGPSRRHTEDYDRHRAPKQRDRDPYERDAPRQRPRDYDEYGPPRRSNTTRDRDRRRYDDHDDEPRPRRRHDDYDRSDDRGYRSDGRPSRRAYDDGYGSDRGARRQGRSADYDRRDRRGGRDRVYSDRDRDYDRDDRERKKKGIKLSAKDIGRYVETGQKHYKTVAPIVNQLAKMYMDNRK